MWNVILAVLEVVLVSSVKTLSLMSSGHKYRYEYVQSQRRSSFSEVELEYEERQRGKGCLWALLGRRAASTEVMELDTITSVPVR